MMGRFKVLGFLALVLPFTLVGATLAGQDRRGDPKSPGGRPLAEVAEKEKELLRTYDQLRKDLADLTAKAKQLDKDAQAVDDAGRALLAALKANDNRVAAAEAAVELGRQLGGVSDRAFRELEAAEREQRALKEDYGRWKRIDDAVKGAQREWSDNVDKLKRRAEAFVGLVSTAKQTAPDSFAEIEKRAKELNQELGKK